MTTQEINWHLVDAVKRHDESPDTFDVPPQDERDDIRVGYLCKLVFTLAEPGWKNPCSERMWVRVKRVSKKRYVGTLESKPVVVSGLKAGDRVEFEPFHIIDIDE